ncbi:MAG: xanthine dehydrogenase accessory factor [Chloroflexota bacterium]|jgi:xanthine dehydrogenase accessory factor|nr:xanthine dehydrogenase accessory factor [Chloroflexota bacterium]
MSDPRDRFYTLAAELIARREPFASATVVHAERPTSAKPGAKAIVTADGRLTGWIGGSCSAPVVIREALGALSDGEPRLVEISTRPSPPREGVRHFPMTCHSGGALEIHIEPILPREQLVIVGRTPLARALAALGSALDRRVVVAEDGVTRDEFPTADAIEADLSSAGIDSRTAIVVATRGDHDEIAVEAALATPARYVGLVSSRTRGRVIEDMLTDSGVSPENLRRLHYPAGLDLGARSDEEIALTILSEILSTRAGAQVAMAAPLEAIDPICGMSVAITADAINATHDGTTYYFCAEGCRRRFLADPVGALAAAR